MAFGSISQTYERETAVDFSYPYDATATGIVSKKPSQYGDPIMGLLRPFEPEVWAAVVVAFAAVVPTYWLSNYKSRQSKAISFSTAFIQCIQCILTQSNSKLQYLGTYVCNGSLLQISGLSFWPKHYCPKGFIFIWVLVAMIIDFGA